MKCVVRGEWEQAGKVELGVQGRVGRRKVCVSESGTDESFKLALCRTRFMYGEVVNRSRQHCQVTQSHDNKS